MVIFGNEFQNFPIGNQYQFLVHTSLRYLLYRVIIPKKEKSMNSHDTSLFISLRPSYIISIVFQHRHSVLQDVARGRYNIFHVYNNTFAKSLFSCASLLIPVSSASSWRCSSRAPSNAFSFLGRLSRSLGKIFYLC